MGRLISLADLKLLSHDFGTLFLSFVHILLIGIDTHLYVLGYFNFNCLPSLPSRWAIGKRSRLGP